MGEYFDAKLIAALAFASPLRAAPESSSSATEATLFPCSHWILLTERWRHHDDDRQHRLDHSTLPAIILELRLTMAAGFASTDNA